MFKVYSSSAGSGKTYTLTKEYLKLALGADTDTYFRSILAVTFTNAAAAEMKDRILSMLREFSKSESPPHAMLQAIVKENYPGIESDPTLFGETCVLYSLRAQKVFRKILHRYSDFSVMTIDKFTQRIVSSFTDELGIPFAFETRIDSDQLSMAVDKMLARIGQEGEHILTEVVETYYRESAESGKSWGSLPHRIREAAQDLLNEKSYLAMQTVSDLDIQDWVGISRQIKAFIREHEQTIRVLARRAMELIEEKQLAESDFSRGSQGIYAYFDKKSQGKDLWKPGNSYVLAAINEDKWSGGKATKYIQEEIAAIAERLKIFCREIEYILEKHQEKASLLALIDKHLYNLSLLGEIRKEFDALLRQGNQVHISDFNRRVLDIVAREPVPFIFERLGEKFNHILVDEFQDTSKLQFANLLPLIDNALGFGNFNLIVGDAKQSIYRFRGGDMDLILHLSKNQVHQLAHILGDSPFTQERLLGIDSYLTVDHLRTNRRSYGEITEFNNRFFACIAQSVENKPGLVGMVFDENFKQEMPPDVKRQGHVQIEFLTEAEEESAGTASSSVMVVRTLELVDELRQKGYHWRDIAILCRKKTEAADIAAALKQRGTPLISDDSLLLTYAPSVSLLISFMQVLQTPDHTLSRYEAAFLFHRIILKQLPDAPGQENIRRMCTERDLSTFLHYFQAFGIAFNAFQLRQLGVYELCEKLIAHFDLFAELHEGPYLFRLLDAILDFGTKRSNHLADFLAYWELEKNKLSITVPANADALRITTIHKSKGLEYPVVIVPNAHWKFLPSGNRDRLWVDLESVQDKELVYERLDQELGILKRQLKSSVVSMVSALEQTPLAASYEDERTRTLLENLNLMYVAFTRPVQRLYILARSAKEWDKCRDAVNKWLYEFLNSDFSPVRWEETRSTYVLWEGAGDCFHHHPKGEASTFPVRTLISNDRGDRLRLRRLAERIFDVETFEKRNDHRQRIRYALSHIQHLGDIPEAVSRLQREGIVDHTQASTLLKDLTTLLQQDELRELFDPGTHVRTQCEFLMPGGRSVLVDRLVRFPDGRVVLLNYVAGMGNDDARRKLRRAMQACADMESTSCQAALLALSDGSVEWLS